MERIMTNIKNDKKVLVCSVISVIFSVLGLVMYIVTSNNTAQTVEILVVATSAIGTITALVSVAFIYMDGAVSIVSAALMTFSMGMFLSSQGGNLGYALSGISDIGYGIQTTFIAGIAFYLIAVISECIAVFGKSIESSSLETITNANN